MIGMIASTRAWSFVLVLGISHLRAATIDEDEARIEALIHAEKAAQAALSAAMVAPEPATSATMDQTVPAPVVAKAIAPPLSELTNDDWLAPAPEQDVSVRFEELSQRIGSRIAVVTTGERVHRGVIAAANARTLTLRVPRVGSGGGATYTLRREQIARIDVR